MPRLEMGTHMGGAPSVGPQLVVQVELASLAIDRDSLRAFDANERQVTGATTDRRQVSLKTGRLRSCDGHDIEQTVGSMRVRRELRLGPAVPKFMISTSR